MTHGSRLGTYSKSGPAPVAAGRGHGTPRIGLDAQFRKLLHRMVARCDFCRGSGAIWGAWQGDRSTGAATKKEMP